MPIHALLDKDGNPIPAADLPAAIASGKVYTDDTGTVAATGPNGERALIRAKDIPKALAANYQIETYETQREADLQARRGTFSQQATLTAENLATQALPIAGQALLNLRGEADRKAQIERQQANPTLSAATKIGGTAAGFALTGAIGGAARLASGAKATVGLAEAVEAANAAKATGQAVQASRALASLPFAATVAAPAEIAGHAVTRTAQALGAGAKVAGAVGKFARYGVEGGAIAATDQVTDDLLHDTPINHERLANVAASGTLLGAGTGVGLAGLGAAWRGTKALVGGGAKGAAVAALRSAEKLGAKYAGIDPELLKKYGPVAASEAEKPAETALYRWRQAPKIREQAARDVTDGLEKFKASLDDVIDATRLDSKGKFSKIAPLIDKSEAAVANQAAFAAEANTAINSTIDDIVSRPQIYGQVSEHTYGNLRTLARDVLEAPTSEARLAALDLAKHNIAETIDDIAYLTAKGTGDLLPSKANEQIARLKLLRNTLQEGLERENTWGKAATANKEINRAMHEYLHGDEVGIPHTGVAFDDAFMSRLKGTKRFGDVQAEGLYNVSRAKIQRHINNKGHFTEEPAELLLRRQVAKAQELSATVAKHYGGELPAKAKALEDATAKIKAALNTYEGDLTAFRELETMAANEARGLGSFGVATGSLATMGQVGLMTGSPVTGLGLMGLRSLTTAAFTPLKAAQGIITVRAALAKQAQRTENVTARLLDYPIAMAPRIAATFAAPATPSDQETVQAIKSLDEFKKLDTLEKHDAASRAMGAFAEQYPRQTTGAAQQLVRKTEWLAEQAPKPVKTQKLGQKPQEVFAKSDLLRFKRQLAVATDPHSALEAVASGRYDPVAIDALRNMAPLEYEAVRSAVEAALESPNKAVSANKAKLLKMVFGLDTTDAIDPASTGAAQQTAAMLLSRDQQGGGGGGGGNSKMQKSMMTRSQQLEVQ